MIKVRLFTILISSLLSFALCAQTCAITEVTAQAEACEGNYFSATVDLEVENPASDSFMLAGNGTVYGKFAYTDLPVTVGPLFGDAESTYEFIAWDLEDGMCQEFTTLAAADCGPICSITNFELEFVACVSDVSAIVVFDFDYENPGGLTFDLLDEEGELISTYLYESLPVTIPFFEVNGAAPIVLTVCDHENDDCCETFVLDAIDCDPDNCEIFSVTFDPDCNGPNFDMTIDFGHDNQPSDSFYLTGNNLNYGTFAYSDLPITVGPLNGGTDIIWSFDIEDTENSACSTTAVYGMYNCPPPCHVQSLEAMALECNGNEAYSLLIGLDIEGEGDLGFAVFSENAYYGNYMYDELPLTLPAYEGSGEFIDYVSICDTEYLECCSTTPFEALLCAGCLIYNIEAFPLPCNDDDEIFIQIDFDYTNQSNEGFEVTGNGENYGEFAYEDLPIQIGPFVGDGSQYFEFVVTDLINPLCFDAVELGFIDCDTICELSNLTVETGECTGHNSYVATIDFDYQGVSGVGFDVIINGENYGFYDYDDLPLTIEEFPSSGTGSDMITVCENNNENCCASLVFDSPECACSIFDVNVETLGCSTDSTFEISVEYFYENLPGDAVDVFLDGVLLGFFNVDEIPIILDIPEGVGTAVLSVCANDLGSCCDEVIFELTNCVCGISDLNAETGECNSDSTYVLDFTFETTNTSSDSIDVYANGDFVGRYEIHPDFNRIEQYPVQETDSTILVVCVQGEDGCCDTLTFETPDCSTFGQCNIWDLVAEYDECTSDSTYILHVDFNSVNLPVDSVTITANGEDLGQFEVTDSFIAIDGVPAFDSSTTTIVVCAVGEPDCCAEVTIETPNCDNFGICNIWDLVAEFDECDSDSSYILHVDFNSEYLPVDSVTITANGENLGQFEATDDFIAIPGVPAFDSSTTTIVVCAVGAPDCCAEVTIETPDCENFGLCNIWDLEIELGDCLTDTTYLIHIDFNFQNLPSDSVIIYGNGNVIGQFEANNDGITIEHFPVFESDNTTITICAVGAPDCCANIIYETPDCEGTGECNIWDLVAEVDECDSDSTFILHVDFNSENLPTDSVTITVNGENMGQFEVTDGFIAIPNVPVSEEPMTGIIVCAVGAPDCCEDVSIETPDCDNFGQCEIWDLEIAIGDCTSDTTYTVHLEYNFDNLPSDSVLVYGNGNLIGQYEASNEGITIEHFPQYESGNTTISICAVGAPDCCDVIEFETPNCEGGGECNIFDLVADFGECNSDTTFSVFIQYLAVNLPTDSVIVTSDNGYMGQFEHNPDGFTISDFPAAHVSSTTLTVCAVGNGECCDDFTLETPDCGQGFDCEIYNLFAEVGDCTSDTTFVVDILFDANSLPTDSVDIYAEGNYLGTYLVQPDFIRIENFPTIDIEFIVITVCAQDNSECCASYTIESPNCSGDCEISEISVDVFDCNTDSTFVIVVDFEYENLPGAGVDIYSGDINLGFFTFDQIPVEVNNFPGNDSGDYTVTICESDGMECCSSFSFDGPVCGGGGCSIFDVAYTMTECDSAGNFYFIIDFDFNNVGDQGFDVAGNGNDYGNFSYDDLPLELGPFAADETPYEFIISDGANPDCSAVIEPGIVKCFVSTLPVDFVDFFTVFNNGSIPGIHAKKDLELSMFNSSGKNIIYQLPLSADDRYELLSQPAGLYIAILKNGQHVWPVKLIKSGE